MPHIHLETTADLPENADVPDILEALVARLAGFETIQPASIKAYHTLRTNWTMGEGSPAGFAHCTVAIMTGRDADLRKRMAQAMFEELRTKFEASHGAGEASLTLELREMDRETYLKA
jgi:5-carboxymethyl-2-hydroxymuconate isomerase